MPAVRLHICKLSHWQHRQTINKQTNKQTKWHIQYKVSGHSRRTFILLHQLCYRKGFEVQHDKWMSFDFRFALSLLNICVLSLFPLMCLSYYSCSPFFLPALFVTTTQYQSCKMWQYVHVWLHSETVRTVCVVLECTISPRLVSFMSAYKLYK